MANQTQMNGKSTHQYPHKGLGRSLADLKDDVVSLAELQWQLLMQDCQAAVRGSIVPTAVAAVGVVLIGCAIPVALLGAARLLVEAGLPLAWSMLAVAGGTALVGAMAGYFGMRSARRSIRSFDRSRGELNQNIAWLKRALQQAGTDDRT
ncbi:MAG: phage holin family protein [Planctomycetota bacterium]|nr:MAG: phage holin family protein [Planctomycetota bacterium]